MGIQTFDLNGNLINEINYSFEEQKQLLKEQITNIRKQKNEESVLVFNTYLLSLSTESLSSLKNCYDLSTLSNINTITLKAKNGYFSISLETLKNILIELNTKTQNNFNFESNANIQLDLSDETNLLNNFNYLATQFLEL
jgi:hypothetical protein